MAANVYESADGWLYVQDEDGDRWLPPEEEDRRAIEPNQDGRSN
ncbi:hypothetical protein [Amycolatopsis thermoflava]